MCKVLHGYYSWGSRGRSPRQQERERLNPKVTSIHRKVGETYGACRISEERTAQENHVVVPKMLPTLMALTGVFIKLRKTIQSDIVDYIEMFYNSKRRHSYLGYLSPRQFEKMMALKKAA